MELCLKICAIFVYLVCHSFLFREQASSSSFKQSCDICTKITVKRWQWQRGGYFPCGSRNRKHRKEANQVLQLYLIAKGTRSSNAALIINERTLLSGSAKVIREGIWSVALIIHYSIMSLSTVPRSFPFKVGKNGVMWPSQVWALKPNWQTPVNLQSSRQ